MSDPGEEVLIKAIWPTAVTNIRGPPENDSDV